MAWLGMAILVGLLLAVTTPGFADEKDPEPAWMKQAEELSQQWKQHRQKENELCAQRAQTLGGGLLHCMTHFADRDLGADYDAPKRVERRWEKSRRSRVKELLDAGVDANTRDFAKNTPLHIVASGGGDPELLAILLKGGANPNLVNSQKVTPLMMASVRGHLAAVEMLLHHGAAKTVNARGELKDEAYRGFTALHWAAIEGHPEITRSLLRVGADPYSKIHGRTALDLADLGRRAAKGSAVRHYETIKIIRQAQAMVTEQMKEGTKKKRKSRLRLQPL